MALLLSIASDASYSYANLWTVLPGYATLAFHAVASIALEQTQSVFPPSVTPQMVTAASALGSCILAVPLYSFRTLMVGVLGLISFCTANPGALQLENVETPSMPLSSLVVIPLLAASLTYFSPTTNNAMKAVSAPSHIHVLSFSTLSMFGVLFGFLAFVEHPTWMDPLSGLLLFIGMFHPRKSVRMFTSRAFRST